MQSLVLSRMQPSGPPVDAQTVHPAPGTQGIPTRRPGNDINPVQHYNEIPVVITTVCMPWPDGSEQLLQTGSLAFCGRNTLATRNNIVSIYKLNEILRLGARLGEERLGLPRNGVITAPDLGGANNGNVTDPSNVPFNMRALDNDMRTTSSMSGSVKDIHKKLKDALAKEGGITPSASDIAFVHTPYYYEALALENDKDFVEEELKKISVFKTLNAALVAADPSLVKTVSTYDEKEDRAYTDLLNFYVQQRDTSLRYLTVDGIRRMWNFLGVVNNTNRGKGMQSLPALMPENGSGQISPIVANIIVQRRCVVPNIWDDGVNEMSHLYLVLTREFLGEDKDGKEMWDDYQFIPWYSNNAGEQPPPSLLLHRDFTGHTAAGYSIYVGAVSHRNSGVAPRNTRRVAAGLRPFESNRAPSIIASWEQTGSLETLEVDLKLFQ